MYMLSHPNFPALRLRSREALAVVSGSGVDGDLEAGEFLGEVDVVSGSGADGDLDNGELIGELNDGRVSASSGICGGFL